MGDRSAPVATGYTHKFVMEHLPAGADAVLEVGCGNGELAARLAGGGLDVLAIDSDAACVEAARAAGVDARLSAWPAAMDRKFDAVLFTRSLHHIEPLAEAVSSAVKVLRPGGRIIVEDFRAEGGSERGSAWFTGLVRVLHACGAVTDADALLAKIAPDDHDHHLHSSMAIAGELARCGSLERADSAYYFRYLEPELSEAVGSALLAFELAAIDTGGIDALGRRFVLAPNG